MVKKRKGKLMSKALKKALKEPPCKNNPYGIKCDKKLEAVETRPEHKGRRVHSTEAEH